LSDRSSMDGCRCFYAAFFSHLRLYFKSWRYLTKRMKFKRKLPLIYKEIKFFLDRTQT
jgi:hypothetical protein